MKLSHFLAARAAAFLIPLLFLPAVGHAGPDETIVRVHDRTKPLKTHSKPMLRRDDSALDPQQTIPDRHLSRGVYLAREALSYRGVPYRFGGTTRSGIDCSGLIEESCRRWGVYLPRTAVQQFYKGTPVPIDKLMPGDLVFFKNTYKLGISHVGIYVGQGKMVHASSSHKSVTVSSISEPYYLNRYAGARRMNLEKLPLVAQDAHEPATSNSDRAETTGGGM